MILREAINSTEFNIIGLTADNMERRLEIRLGEIDRRVSGETGRITVEQGKRIFNRSVSINRERLI